MAFSINVNGKTHSVDVDGDTPVLWVLRDVLGMTGTKFGCGLALCGACTVHINGAPHPFLHHASAKYRQVADHNDRGDRHDAHGARIQQAWVELRGAQCGYCQSGQIMSAAALLASNPNPSDTDIDGAMSETSVVAGRTRASARASSARHTVQGTTRGGA